MINMNNRIDKTRSRSTGGNSRRTKSRRAGSFEKLYGFGPHNGFGLVSRVLTRNAARLGIGTTGLAVLAYLLAEDQRGPLFPSLSVMAKSLGFSVQVRPARVEARTGKTHEAWEDSSGLRKAIKSLERAGVLKVTARAGHSSVYDLQPLFAKLNDLSKEMSLAKLNESTSKKNSDHEEYSVPGDNVAPEIDETPEVPDHDEAVDGPAAQHATKITADEPTRAVGFTLVELHEALIKADKEPPHLLSPDATLVFSHVVHSAKPSWDQRRQVKAAVARLLAWGSVTVPAPSASWSAPDDANCGPETDEESALLRRLEAKKNSGESLEHEEDIVLRLWKNPSDERPFNFYQLVERLLTAHAHKIEKEAGTERQRVLDDRREKKRQFNLAAMPFAYGY
jgi:hypothetical protein